MASESRQPKMEWVFVEFDPMLTTDTAIHSNTRYCIITQYILQDCSIASAGSVAEGEVCDASMYSAGCEVLKIVTSCKDENV